MPAIVMPAVYRTLFIVPSSVVPSLYVVGSIAVGRRSFAVLAIVATLPPSELLLTSWLGHRSLAC
jgi:hypothetical protein